MKLVKDSTRSFALHVAGYQFPELENEDYDSNWLNIRIDVLHPEGSWTATDPSLLTYELRELGTWLASITKNPAESSEIDFIEPNLKFQYRAESDPQILRILFELESRPGWAPSDGAGMEDLWVDIPFAREDFESAAAAIAEECRRFPQRTKV
ncbi:MAG: hypothetical protein AAGC74_12160 [Verrucomicrobiota bacterium]